MLKIEQLSQYHIDEVSSIHKEVFPRQGYSKEWIQSNFNAFPRIIMYVALIENQPVGYIQWIQKSGFRKETILELEQIGVSGKHQGKGVAKILTKESLKGIKSILNIRGANIKTIYVTTRTDNYAQEIYKNILGVREVAILPGLYSADEVFLARTF